MPLQFISHKSIALTMLAGLMAASWQTGAASAEGPFLRFAGHWRGDGTITMSDGTKEALRCRVAYSIGNAGTMLTQDLVCASQSYKFDVSSQVEARGDQLSGSWTETTRNVTGSVSGTVHNNTIQATVTGGVFSAGLALAVRGNTQYVRIRPDGQTDVTNVVVTLRRG